MAFWPVSRIAGEYPSEPQDWESQSYEALQCLLSTQPYPVDLFHAIGHAARRQQRNHDALEAYSQAIEHAQRYHSIIHFEHSAILLRRALLHFEAGEQGAAQADVTAALFQDHTNLVATHLAKHGYDAHVMLPAYRACLWELRSQKAQLKRVSPAQATLSDFEEQMDASTARWQQGEAQAAERHYRLLLNDYPDNPLLQHRFAWVSHGSEAMDAIQKALTLWSKYHATYHRGAALHLLHRGEVHMEMEEYVLAKMDFIRAKEMDVRFTEPVDALKHLETRVTSD